MVNSLDDEEEIKYRKPMNENLIFVLAVSFIFIVATSGTPYSESDNLNITSIPCHKIKGEVILKEIQEEEYLIYVELFMDNNLDGYIVTVSEGSLCRLAVGLNKLGHEVDIFGGLGMKSQGVNIMDYDAVIVQRYLNFLIYEDTNHPNIILWLHDTIALPWYKGVAIEDSGKNLYELAARNNIFRKSVVLTPFHERKIRSVYELPQGHFEVIGHGINQEIDTNDLTKKIPYRMIWIRIG